MSGIYGFTYRTADTTAFNDTLGGLEYWNRMYGNTESGQRRMERSGFGCHVEHFSNQFSHGAPILELDGKPAVVDALLYNRDDLTAVLHLGDDCALSDEELLLELIEQKGFEALAMVNGDFAGAVFDAEKQEWTIFRDQMGVRPLYYYQDENLIAFSTDMRGLLAIPGIDDSINAMLLYKRLLRLSTLSPVETDFEFIRCILPGSVCRFRVSGSGITRAEQVYWQIRRKRIRFRTDEEYRRELRRLVEDAVHRRCDAIPAVLGAELSGGLDSSIIDILVNRYGRDAVYYSWSLDPEVYPLQEGEDERKVVMDICRQEGIQCRYMRPEDRFNYDYALEQAMPPHISTPHICFGSRWMKRQGANAVFTGHGGDEGISHRAARLELLYNGEWLSYFKLYWRDTEGLSLRLLRTLNRGVREGWAKWRKLHPKPGRKDRFPSFLDPQFCAEMSKKLRVRPLPFCYDPCKYVRWGGSRPRMDSAAFWGAFSGVRYLFPYVDYRVMEYAISIPRRLHVNEKTSRLIFRETFADLMPKSLQAVDYKDLPSGRSVDRVGSSGASTRRYLDYLLTKLDPSVWQGIIDFDHITEISARTVTTPEEALELSDLLSKLNQSVFIQNARKEAQRWRERDD